MNKYVFKCSRANGYLPTVRPDIHLVCVHGVNSNIHFDLLLPDPKRPCLIRVRKGLLSIRMRPVKAPDPEKSQNPSIIRYF